MQNTENKSYQLRKRAPSQKFDVKDEIPKQELKLGEIPTIEVVSCSYTPFSISKEEQAKRKYKLMKATPGHDVFVTFKYSEKESGSALVDHAQVLFHSECYGIGVNDMVTNGIKTYDTNVYVNCCDQRYSFNVNLDNKGEVELTNNHKANEERLDFHLPKFHVIRDLTNELQYMPHSKAILYYEDEDFGANDFYLSGNNKFMSMVLGLYKDKDDYSYNKHNKCESSLSGSESSLSGSESSPFSQSEYVDSESFDSIPFRAEIKFVVDLTSKARMHSNKIKELQLCILISKKLCDAKNAYFSKEKIVFTNENKALDKKDTTCDFGPGATEIKLPQKYKDIHSFIQERKLDQYPQQGCDIITYAHIKLKNPLSKYKVDQASPYLSDIIYNKAKGMPYIAKPLELNDVKDIIGTCLEEIGYSDITYKLEHIN